MLVGVFPGNTHCILWWGYKPSVPGNQYSVTSASHLISAQYTVISHAVKNKHNGKICCHHRIELAVDQIWSNLLDPSCIMSATKLAAHTVVLMRRVRIYVLWNRNANGVVNKRWLHIVCLQMK